MFKITVLIGIFSYALFFLGVFGLYYKNLLVILSLIFLLISLISIFKNNIKFKTPTKTQLILLIFLIIQASVNFIGVLGPEIAFDALWYHLTLPKIFLENHSLVFIPGGNLYYSALPKLTELMYLAGLSFGFDYLPKLIHFTFGILSLLAIYKVARKFVNRELSLLSAIIFYSSLVVGWESMSAYVDLSRSFFEIMSFWAFLNWHEQKKQKWIVMSGLLLGLAASVKLISISSGLIYLVIFIYLFFKDKTNIQLLLKHFFLFTITLLIPLLPWLIKSYIDTGNFIYPYFSNINVDSGSVIVLPKITSAFHDFYVLFLNSNDPISPAYLIFIPLIVFVRKRFHVKEIMLVIYSLMAILIWYVFLQNRGTRFILPYLPIASILIVITISLVKMKSIKLLSYVVILLIALISITYRFGANYKFIPVIIGQETVNSFLSKNLNFSYGDFYDSDNFFKTNIKPTDRVLLIGFHNLYYVNFPFIDSSWVKKGDIFNYIATQHTSLPKQYSNFVIVYNNNLTGVKLYKSQDFIW